MHRLDVAIHTSIQFDHIQSYYPPLAFSSLTVSILGLLYCFIRLLAILYTVLKRWDFMLAVFNSLELNNTQLSVYVLLSLSTYLLKGSQAGS